MANKRPKKFSFLPPGTLVTPADGEDISSIHSNNLVIRADEQVTVKGHGWEKGKPIYEIVGRRSFYLAGLLKAVGPSSFPPAA